LGWRIGNITYEKMGDVPDFNSPMGKCMILVWGMRHELEYYRNRALVIAQKHSDNPKALDEVFKDVWNATFPFQERTQEKQDKKALDNMMKEINRGPLTVNPIAIPKKPPRPRTEINIGQVSDIDSKSKKRK
jgi:hypothetical protein